MSHAESDNLRRFTRAEYHRMGEAGLFDQERVELVHGLVRRKVMIGKPHSFAVRRLTRILVSQLLDRAEVLVQLPVAADDYSEPEPDLAVCPPGRYLDDHPAEALLVIEVSMTSLAFDRKVKGPLYAAMGVAEYWVVNLVEGVIEVHTDPADGAYQQVRLARPGEVLLPTLLEGIEVPVAEVIPPVAP